MWCYPVGMFPVPLDVELGTIIGLKLGLPWWLSGKESACNAGDMGLQQFLGREGLLEKEMATHSSILA